MTKARVLTTAGVAHLAVATLLSMAFLFGQPVTVVGSALGFTPTYTPTVTPPSTTPEPRLSPRLTITKTADSAEVLPGEVGLAGQEHAAQRVERRTVPEGRLAGLGREAVGRP